MEGNVILGYTSTTFFMLDVDYSTKKKALWFAEEYGKKHKLGSSLVILTSKDGQRDLFNKKLQKYAVIFGKPITFAEIQWHINEARRLGMCERKFVAMRKVSYITIRVNDKNNHISYPKIVAYYPSGETESAEKRRANTGVNHFLLMWRTCKMLGSRERDLPESEQRALPSDISIVRRLDDYLFQKQHD
jgi:hypothetical protein